LKERDVLSGGPTGDGPVQAMSSEGIAREWDSTKDVAARRAMLRDATGPDQVRVLPAARRKLDPDRVMLVSPETPLSRDQHSGDQGGAGRLPRSHDSAIIEA
jgi:hypothetical protein